MKGPLEGVRIIEMAGIGPGPFAAMMLADHGAEVIRIDRPDPPVHGSGSELTAVLNRSRAGLNVNLKMAEGIDLIRRLCRTADGLVEGFRPGVMERLGLGPDLLLSDNKKLVYGRVTGWGQDGPYAHAAGHDLNYIALSGALHAIGRKGGRPAPPLNLVGDFGGGGMMLAFGMVSAILNARRTGLGQVVDCAMTEGSAVLMAMMYSIRAAGEWDQRRGHNIIDSGAHFYDTYQTSDGQLISIASLEPQFYRELLIKTGLAGDEQFEAQYDRSNWPHLKSRLEALFVTKTRAEWCEIFEGSDVCFAPVMTMEEAPRHPHNLARDAFVEVEGAVQPSPAPRYSVTPNAVPTKLRVGDEVSDRLLGALGYSSAEIEHMRRHAIIS